jgi:lipopolysaccharide transport system ATP-binding protein
MSANIAISVRELGKRYRLGSGQQHDSLRDLLAAMAGGFFQGRRRAREEAEFWALRDVNFDIAHGENVGIIGLNGAGKSTLLKILSRITEPTSGSARIEGRVGALLEVGTGFHPELTGRENVYLYGSILGMPRAEIASKFDAIVDFAGIEDFIDTPVKRYSSGMYVRLAFAVAAHLEPEVLMLDEVLAVGDLTFQRKCIDFAKKLQQRQATILFVSHNMFSIKTMCSRVIYLRKGRVEFDGPTDAGIERYERDCRLATLPWVKENPAEWPIAIEDVALLGEDDQPKTVFDFGERMTVRLTYNATRAVQSPNFIVAFLRSDSVACCNYSSDADGFGMRHVQGRGVIEFTTPPLKLVAEVYSISVLVRGATFDLMCAQHGGTFHVRHTLYDAHFGVFHESAEWRIAAEAVRAVERRALG